jgi:hypothetical protein
MNFILTALLVVPSAPITTPTPKPATPLDGPWTIVAVEHNGKKLDSSMHVTIADGRLDLNPGAKGEAARTLELAADHVAWLWAGPSKMVWVPAQEYSYWIGNVLNRDPRYELKTVTPGHWETVAQEGIYVERDGLLYVIFGARGSGPSLALTLRRDPSTPTATQSPH